MAQKKYQSVRRARAVKIASTPVSETPSNRLMTATIPWRLSQGCRDDPGSSQYARANRLCSSRQVKIP